MGGIVAVLCDADGAEDGAPNSCVDGADPHTTHMLTISDGGVEDQHR